MLQHFSRDFGDWPSLNSPEKHLRAFGLNLNLPVVQPGFGAGFPVTRVGHDEHHFAVEHVDANVGPGDNFADIPFTGLFRIEQRGDAIAGCESQRARFPDDALLARPFAAIRHARVIFEDDRASFDVHIAAGHAPPLADPLLHDVALDRAHPSQAASAVLADAPVKEA